jgi:hypothetical protein
MGATTRICALARRENSGGAAKLGWGLKGGRGYLLVAITQAENLSIPAQSK